MALAETVPDVLKQPFGFGYNGGLYEEVPRVADTTGGPADPYSAGADMGEDTRSDRPTPARAIAKAPVPEWTWHSKALTVAEYESQYPLTKWTTLLLCAPLGSTPKSFGFYLATVVVRRTCSTYRSERRMSRESGWSRSTVQKALDALAELGWVTVVKKQGATATVWLSWPFAFTPTGPPAGPVDEGEEASEDDLTGPPDGPPLDRFTAPLDRLTAPLDRFSAPTGPPGGPNRSLPIETDMDTARRLDALRQVRQETGK